jgi:hypothetical protein
VAWLLLCAVFFVGLALVHAERVNVDLAKYDQDSYLAFAALERQEGFAALGSRRQMPIYPMVQALFNTPGMSNEAFFARAKLVNIGLSALVALGVWVLLSRLLPKVEARNVALVTTFFVIAFRAPYVQAEVLSYACIFGLFLLFCSLWRRPSVPVAALAGALAAFAFFVKATALLGLYVFVACYALREVLRWREGGKMLARLAILATAVGTFAVLVAPYAKTSKALYGSYLYDMNTRYVMWCDSWREFQDLNVRFGPHDGWRDLPTDQIPSMQRYLATHSLGQIAAREVRGLVEVVGNCVISHGYAPFFLMLLVFGGVLVLRNADLRRKVFRLGDPEWLGWFVLPYLSVHFLALGFYGVVGAGERFSLAMFLPAMYAMTRAFAGTAGTEHRVRFGALELDWARFQSAFFAFAILELMTYWPVAMATHYSGG